MRCELGQACCTCGVRPAVAQRDQRAQQVFAAVRSQVVVRIHPQREVEARLQVVLLRCLHRERTVSAGKSLSGQTWHLAWLGRHS